MPHYAPRRTRLCSGCGINRRHQRGRYLGIAGLTVRLAIIRQRYTPYGGAERFVESALEALLERGVAISLYTRQWPNTRLQLIEPVLCNRSISAVCGATGASPARCAVPSQKGAGVGAVARAPALLRHLSRGRRSASGLARRASAPRIGIQALADRVELLPSISARRRAPAVRKSLAARGHLQFKDGPRRDSRALRLEPRETAGDL